MDARFLAPLAFALATGVAHAAPVSFDRSDEGAEKIVSAVMPELVGAPAVRVDLGRAQSDVMVRVGDDCSTACRHVGLAWYGDDWHVTFDVPATTLEIGENGYGGYRRVVVDGRIEMEWRLDGYAPSPDGTVDTAPVEGAAARAMAAEFGEGALALLDAGRTTVEAAPIDPTGGAVPNVWLVILRGEGTCARAKGCPFRVLAVRDGAWMTLAEGHGDGVKTIDATRAGWADLVATRPVGFGRYGWTSKGYVALGAGS